MSKNNGNSIEQHIDKIILAVVGLIGLYVLYAFVISSPNTVEVDGEMYGPGGIDAAVHDKAQRVKVIVDGQPIDVNAYKPQSSKFTNMLATALKSIDTSMIFPLPGSSDALGPIGNLGLPTVVDVCDVKVRAVKAVAYVPMEEVDVQNPYNDSQTELMDVDFVTVEAKVDAAELCRRFEEIYNNPSADPAARHPDWKPVFAKFELQRRELLDNGQWSEWGEVGRIKSDVLKKLFNVPSSADKLERGIDVYRLIFDKPEIRAELLQPSTYDFAYPLEAWLPPGLALEQPATQTRTQRDPDAARRKAEEAAAKRAARASSRSTGGAGGMGGGMVPGMGGGGMGGPGMGGGMGMGGGGRTTATRQTREPRQPRERNTRNNQGVAPGMDMGMGMGMPGMGAGTTTRQTSTASVSGSAETTQKLAKIKLTDKTDLSKLKEPIVVWAHDDTTEPGKTYQYRVRIGVFNPAAGTNLLSKEFAAMKNEVILWGNYSAETTPVTLAQRWYFFPVEFREADKMVTAKVCRYLLGKWYIKDYRVRPGEIVGNVAVNAKGEDAEETEPNEIDYSNGVTMVDVMAPGEKDYADVIYTMDGKMLKHLAVKQQYWTSDIKTKYGEITDAEKNPRGPLVGRGAEGLRAPSFGPDMMGPGMGMPGMGMPGMGMPGMGMPGMGMPGF